MKAQIMGLFIMLSCISGCGGDRIDALAEAPADDEGADADTEGLSADTPAKNDNALLFDDQRCKQYCFDEARACAPALGRPQHCREELRLCLADCVRPQPRICLRTGTLRPVPCPLPF